MKDLTCRSFCPDPHFGGPSTMPRKSLLYIMLPLCLAGVSCAPPAQMAPQGLGPAAMAGNPFFVAANNHEGVWERAVDVIHDYQFQIARENKLDGIIETQYKTGSGLLEPWHRDSVGLDNRLESSLQSLRRRAFVSITPAQGGYLVGVEVFKELEDMVGLAANSAGGATFQESAPLQRDLNLVVGQSAPSGWIPQGRDPRLEQDMIRRLQLAFSR